MTVTIRYSKSTSGFYDSRFNKTYPDDAVEISLEYYNELIYQQSQNGKNITWSEDLQAPIAVDFAGPTQDELASAVRSTRDCRMLCALDATGKYTTQQALIASGGTVGSPITEQEYISVLQYIEDLRNIPQQSGFPWNGPDDIACPWPTKPACVCDHSIA